MATTNRIYILAAFCLSGIAALVSVLSLSTEQWINGKLYYGSISEYFHVNYGLFNGNYRRSVGTYEIQITCNFSHNACAMLCSGNYEKSELLNELLNGINRRDDDPTSSCGSTSSSSNQLSANGISAKEETFWIDRKNFINAGVWLCTILCLILATVIGAAASGLALLNTISNPIQFYLSVQSLFFYNGFAFTFTLMYMIFWGAMYNINIFHNVALYDTLSEMMTSDRMVYLGYSYWISFVPLTLYAASIGVLFYREYLNTKDPKQMVSLDDSTDPNIYLY